LRSDKRCAVGTPLYLAFFSMLAVAAVFGGYSVIRVPAMSAGETEAYIRLCTVGANVECHRLWFDTGTTAVRGETTQARCLYGFVWMTIPSSIKRAP
jgi:hypothetical protein